ncbi:ABC transporter ATP-binding protein [Pseudofrankia sp. BMG5.36]|uniref:ABC transporter ATP-binding protein n=1 Tax=Pseudofrankia sp. BMG5.36 TaxID=1834512 RepID=UPI0008DA510A|nr:ABC transporter ATP-binding protein [Pseudofrankia sp. BMG5.36]OHV42608.1 multidrug ABC transporter ATP-binding protein [Pseudofrankia sp. BMG5.36]
MLLRLLLPYARPYGRDVALVAALQVAQTGAALYLPYLSADVIDNGVLTGDTGYIWRLGALMTGVSLAQLLCAVGAARVAARMSTFLARDLRAAMFDRVQSFSARELHRFGAASLTVRTTNDIQQVQMLVQTTLTFMVTAPIMCVGGIVFALAQDAPLSLLLVVVAPVLGGLAWAVLRRMTPLSVTLQDTTDSVNRIMREQIIGLRVIRAFVREEHEHTRFEVANDLLTDTSARVGRIMALMFPLVTAVASVSSVAVVWFGAGRVESGAIGVGALSAFLGYVLQILGAAVMMTYLLRMLPRAEVCARRIGEGLATESTVAPPAAGVAALPHPARVELRDVEFRYPGAEAPVLAGVSLTAGPGETVAVVGGTGSGKSTLLSLIPRLADPSAGAVLVGGSDVRRLDRALLSRTVGYVPQRPYLFSGTVASNLHYGDPDATEDDLWRALDIAQARAFVEALPEGLAAPVTQGGTNLSGGQRQRIAIARALVGRPDVYLFDDSFSALDYATDARLRAALTRETSGSTVVIVAQRVNTIRGADRIVVLDEGRVVGTGTHRELFAGNPTYREIVLSQLTETEAA